MIEDKEEVDLFQKMYLSLLNQICSRKRTQKTKKDQRSVVRTLWKICNYACRRLSDGIKGHNSYTRDINNAHKFTRQKQRVSVKTPDCLPMRVHRRPGESQAADHRLPVHVDEEERL
jgi:hypothetical protein